MVLSMTRPFKHPKTGVYWLRKAVPHDLRKLVGKVEEKKTLGTKNASEAKLKLATALAEVETRWANLRRGPQVLTEVQAHEIAAPVYDEWIRIHSANPSEQRVWNTEVGVAGVWGPPPEFYPAHLIPALQNVGFLQERCFQTADDLLAKAGLSTDDVSRKRLARAVSAAMHRASLKLEQMALGGEAEVLVPPSRASVLTPFVKPVSFDQLVKEWAAERKPAKKTLYEWTRIVKALKKFVRHNDATKVTVADLNGWKAQMLLDGLKAKTIRDAKIAPVRAIMQWAVDNNHLPANPAARVTLDVKVISNERKRGFRDPEAQLVLSSARKEANPVLRWVPWIAAYTGGRVAELCQLRREDVLKIDAIWCLQITPEAGPLKTLSSDRIVPIHSALIDEGFLKFAETISSGALFKKLPPDVFGSRGGNGAKVIGRWIRSLGITDPRISPNHSWRHRFKTLARMHEVRPDIGDALVGHGKRTVGDGYGEFPVPALKREMEKIPTLTGL